MHCILDTPSDSLGHSLDCCFAMIAGVFQLTGTAERRPLQPTGALVYTGARLFRRIRRGT